MEIFLKNLWWFLAESAPYLLMGLGIAGIVHQYINVNTIKKHLSGDGVGQVIKAALFGVPLPLCSCSVIPSAVTLRKNGASNGATSAFLIATPESGIDSIFMTYAVMDLPMTIIRPIAAFFSATIAGLLQMKFNDFEEVAEEVKSCCAKKKEEEEKKKSSCCSKKAKNPSPVLEAIKIGYIKLADDLAVWLCIGMIGGAAITTFIPADLGVLGSGMMGRLAILVVGIPLYICASASTPIAASLVLKGFSPGTALILLLVGPATNLSNIAVLQKYIGKKGVMINIAVIALVALAFSFIVDGIYSNFNLSTDFKIGNHHEHGISMLGHVSAGVLSLLLIKGVIKEKILGK